MAHSIRMRLSPRQRVASVLLTESQLNNQRIQTMKPHTKLINGYHCEVEIDTDSDPSTQGGWVSKGSCSSSIACVLDHGYIDTICGEHQYEIPDSILHRIEDWAYSVGY